MLHFDDISGIITDEFPDDTIVNTLRNAGVKLLEQTVTKGDFYMKDYILETCGFCRIRAMAAAEGGADRLELCSTHHRGTTPGPWLLRK